MEPKNQTDEESCREFIRYLLRYCTGAFVFMLTYIRFVDLRFPFTFPARFPHYELIFLGPIILLALAIISGLIAQGFAFWMGKADRRVQFLKVAASIILALMLWACVWAGKIVYDDPGRLKRDDGKQGSLILDSFTG